MDGMNNDIMQAIMEALGHVNGDEEGKKGKKMSVTVVDAVPPEMEEEVEGEVPHDPDAMPEHDALLDHADEMPEDDFLNKLKEMHPDGSSPEMPHDDWSEDDMSEHSPSMMMQLAALKKKKPEEDDGDHEYR